ncbi:HD-GYP domain-containing protein [Alkaliphilus sp. MSJ-5]|uniref:HD-GYP domain-containing protein n=1 Tax=Alkaliphilus flagellatus TaxID=2841507 RepID=A0ABS6G4S9_9FIRM|nr:HD-GYP domain-containing protein [Alkaliphilus flagellatus]MBU5677499.1 HD-GYP domain-containing protein [Alkaliphilus flagellatus]
MRLVPIEYAREGNFLAQPLFNDNGQILLSKGVMLNNRLIFKIKEAGFLYLYINDNKDEEVINDVIKPEIRQKAIVSIKKIYSAIAQENGINSQKRLNDTVTDLKNMIDGIVDEMFAEKSIMIQLVDIRNLDNYTYSHSVNVAILSLVIGISYGLNKNDLYDLALGALLHDIGKMFIPENLLKKPGALTIDEFNIVQEHSLRGFNYMKDELNINARSRIISLQHHEKVDGTGYPYKLKDKEINLFSKIVSIADVYDGLTSDRIYRKAIPVHEALEYIMGGCGRLFDFNLVQAFVKKVVPYPIGTFIKLSNDVIGIVENVNLDFPLRPTVKIIKEKGKICSEYIIDLTKENTIVVEDIVYNI